MKHIHHKDEDLVRPSINELVINWHITEACNYSCRYCYAHWSKPSLNREIIHNEISIKNLINELYGFFHPKNMSNALQSKVRWDSVRLNIAGGEPLLYEQKVLQIIRIARDLGMSVSMITNGSKLTNKLMREMASDISLLGISLDSRNTFTNREIGRVDNKGKLLESHDLGETLALGRQINPNMRLKINTVVNSMNVDEDMSPLIQTLQPERWKVLRMLPVLNGDLAVLDSEFNNFVNRHHKLKDVMCIEDNVDMTESYIMVDPYGRFFQNSVNTETRGYSYSEPILAVGVEPAFSAMNFSVEKFNGRYQQIKDEALI